MNIVWRLLGGLTVLLGFGVLAAWAWDKSDALNNPATPGVTATAVVGVPVSTAAAR